MEKHKSTIGIGAIHTTSIPHTKKLLHKINDLQELLSFKKEEMRKLCL